MIVPRYSTANDVWEALLGDVLRYGQWAKGRGRRFLDVLTWTAVLTDPRNRVVTNPKRNLRVGYPAASVAWNLAERDDVDSICWWNERGRIISDDGESFHGANYGQRWSGLLQEAMKLLESDPGTRRSWFPIWSPNDLVDVDYSDGRDELEASTGQEPFYSRWGKDVPCTIGVNARLRALEPGSYGDELPYELDFQVVMRSQSGFFVFPYDLYLFSVIQELVANELGAYLGELHWIALSAHLYEDERAKAVQALEWRRENGPTRELEGAMIPIDMDLTTASSWYPQAFDRFMNDPMPPILEFPSDPVIRQMHQGATEIHAALREVEVSG